MFIDMAESKFCKNNETVLLQFTSFEERKHENINYQKLIYKIVSINSPYIKWFMRTIMYLKSLLKKVEIIKQDSHYHIRQASQFMSISDKIMWLVSKKN